MGSVEQTAETRETGGGAGAGRASASARRRRLRLLGNVLIVVGVLALAWTALVWRWEDPFTAVYTWHEQRQLRSQLADLQAAPLSAHAAGAARLSSAATRAAREAAEKAAIGKAAARLRADASVGQAIGELRVPRLGIDFVVVNGTDDDTLKKGPGRDLRTAMPGQGRLVYIAGHRTTYLAPFSHIERLRPGDRIYLRMPYASFVYRVTSHVIVPADDLAVLRPGHVERLALQACHPRFFATHRYIVWASLVSETPPSRSS